MSALVSEEALVGSIDDAFSVKGSSTSNSSAPSVAAIAASAKPKKESLPSKISGERSQNVEIALKKLGGIDGVVANVTVWDPAVVTLEYSEILLAVLPTSEEASSVQALKEIFDADDKKVALTDRFFLTLAKLAGIASQLSSHMLSLTFSSEVQRISSSLIKVQLGCERVNSSRGLVSLLGVLLQGASCGVVCVFLSLGATHSLPARCPLSVSGVVGLPVGNRLNHGSKARGDSYGLDILDACKKVVEFKGPKKDSSVKLLNVIASFLGDETVQLLSQEFPKQAVVLQDSLAELEREVMGLEKKFDQTKSVVNGAAESPFKEKMNLFVDAASTDFEQLKSVLSETRGEQGNLCRRLSVQPEDVLELFSELERLVAKLVVAQEENAKLAEQQKLKIRLSARLTEEEEEEEQKAPALGTPSHIEAAQNAKNDLFSAFGAASQATNHDIMAEFKKRISSRRFRIAGTRDSSAASRARGRSSVMSGFEE